MNKTGLEILIVEKCKDPVFKAIYEKELLKILKKLGYERNLKDVKAK